MARKKEPGIVYYGMQADHTQHRKIRLLYNDQGAEGYWIWACLLDCVYKIKGYYYNTRDVDDLELLASDICKQPVEKVLEVINCCVRRDLFDQNLFEQYGILTSDRIQTIYLDATQERRRKNTVIEMVEQYCLITDEDLQHTPYNNLIKLISVEESDNSTEQSGSSAEKSDSSVELPRNNSQSKVKESKVKKSRVSVSNDTLVDKSTDGAPLPDQTRLLQKQYEDLVKDKRSVYYFIRDNKPMLADPYKDLWNFFAKEHGLPEVRTLSDARKKKIMVRLKEPEFNLPKILQIAAVSDFMKSSTWFGFDWLIKSPNNYLKVLEGNYNNKQATHEKKTKEMVL